MDDMTVEQMTVRANQVTDEVLNDRHTHTPTPRALMKDETF